MSVENGESEKINARQLLLEDRVEILKQLDNGVSVNSLCERYSISPSTIYEIKKHKNDIMQLLGEYKAGSKHDEIMMLWYQYYKERYGLPTSWMVKEQAFGFHQELKLKTPCRYGEQWLKAFKQEHGISLKDEEQIANRVPTAKNVSKDNGLVNENQNCSVETMKRKHSSPPTARKSVVPNDLENGVSTEQLSKKCKTTHSAIHDIKKLQNVKLKNDTEIKSQKLESKKEHTQQLKLRAFDRALLAWIRDQTKSGGFLDAQSIIKQAKIYHKELRLGSACEYTENWMHEFMKQNHVQYVTVPKNKLPLSEAARRSTSAREKEPREEESLLQKSSVQKIQAYTQEERPQAMKTSTADLPDGCPAAESEEMSAVSPCQQQQQNIKAVDVAPTSDQATDELLTVKHELDESIELGEEIFFDEDGGEDEIIFHPVNSFQHFFNNISERSPSLNTCEAEASTSSQDLVMDKKPGRNADSAFCDWMTLTYLGLSEKQKRRARIKIMQYLTECEETSI